MNIIKIIDVLLLIMACWRLTSLLCDEVGPFELFVRIRKLFGIRHNAQGEAEVYPDTLFGKLFACSWCMSIWISFGLTWGYIFLPTLTIYFALWLALSTGVIVIDGLH